MNLTVVRASTAPIFLVGFISSQGLFLAKDTPAPIVRQLSAGFIKALDLPSVRGRFEPIGEEIPTVDRRTPEYFSKFVAGEIARWSGPIKASGVTVE